MAACADTNIDRRDPRFQALKEAYKDRHYCDDHLAQTLQLCREYHGYSVDWFPETPAQRGVFTRFMNHYLTSVKMSKTNSTLDRDSLYNLYTTLYALYTPEQLDNRLSMLADDFRKVMDDQEFVDRTGRTRQEVLSSLGKEGRNGYYVIMDHIFDTYKKKGYTDKDKLFELYKEANPGVSDEELMQKSEYVAQEFATMFANKDRLTALAAPRIGTDEGFIVRVNNQVATFEEATEDTSLTEGDNTSSENNGEDNEEGSKGDRYGDFRTVKLMSSLSPKARRLLSTIPMVDAKGEEVRDDLGKVKHLSARQATVVLHRVLVNSTSDSMMSDIESASAFYPWLKGLHRLLQEDTDKRTTVFDNCKKAATTFIYTNLENSRYAEHIANSRSAGYALAREAGMNLRGGYTMEDDYSVTVGYGGLASLDKINKLKEEYDKLWSKVNDFTSIIRMVDGDKHGNEKWTESAIRHIKDTYGQDAEYLRGSGEDAMRAFLENNPDVSDTIAKMLRGIGFTVTSQDVINSAMQTMSPKGFSYLAGRGSSKVTRGRNKLYYLTQSIGGVYGRARQILKTGQPATGQYLFNTAGYEFRDINKAIALAKYSEVEDRVLNEGQSLSTYNNVNLLHQVIDLLSNKAGLDEEEYKRQIAENFTQYEGMALGFGENMRSTGWLAKLTDSINGVNRDREKFKLVDIAAFNHVKYNDLTREQKLTSALIQFFEGGNIIAGDDSFSAYEYPIQADYDTAYNFITAPRYPIQQLTELLTDEVLIELERIASIRARQNDNNRAILVVYEEQGQKLQIFPALNDSRFIEEYASMPDATAAKNFVRDAVKQQIELVIARDTKTLEDAKILTNPALQRVDVGGSFLSFHTEDGLISSLGENEQSWIRSYFINTYYAREQMIKLVTGGLEQFNGLIDYEKRNMLSHATHTSIYTNATWKGKQVGRESQNVVYISDDVAKSAFFDDIVEILGELKEQKIISPDQFDTMKKAYTDIKTTDGQGFRTLESYRDVAIMTDEWSDNLERAYNRIMAGKPKKSDISLFLKNRKPVMSGFEHINAAAGESQKPVRATVLHKYSEQVLLPVTLAKYCLQAQSVPMQALDRAQERLKRQGKQIDMFLCLSGVKVGAHSVLQPFARNDKGQRILNDARSIEDYIVDTVNGKESTMHVIPYKYYGIAAATPVHSDDRIAWAAQAEKVVMGNVEKGEKINVRGKEMNAWDARELYNAIKTANVVEQYARLRQLFTDPDELEKLFQDELESRTYVSGELRYALAHLKDGTFAVPLYSPNVEHQVQQLLASIIKKRLTKATTKGANILQSTGFGVDIDASIFDNTNALSESEKLHIVFTGKGKNKRIKYVEVYLNIDSFDSRLRMFADENGNIDSKRMQELIDKGVIPESMLEFIAYRTPSDAEHSVIPCRIKGFTSNLGGANILMPKEIMVMTGHDYDGDKMRCHFKSFHIVDKDGSDVSDFDKIQMVLGLQKVNETFRKCEVYEYDYSKDNPLDNSQEARNNAKVELMFSMTTSPEGTRRMLIPGAIDESKVMAKTLNLVRMVKDKVAQQKIAEALVSQNMDAATAQSAVRNTYKLFNVLSKKTDKQLTNILRTVSGTEVPYSMTHAADAFDYIMGGAQMISVYAKYNSAFAVFKRANLEYVPKLTQKGYPYTVKMFGHTFGKLFSTRNHKDEYASLGFSRLLQAAVDNGKDPILGYLNQTPELADMTFLLFAAGLTENEVHLILNQPSVVELNKRLKARGSDSMIQEIEGLVSELIQDNPNFDINQYAALKKMATISEDELIRPLAMSHEDIIRSEDADAITQQITVLRTLEHLTVPANNLATFVRLTRPDSESGAIGTTVADIISKNIDLNTFRSELTKPEEQIQISGMREILAHRDVHEGWDTSYIMDLLGDKLPEIVALNSLMIETSLDMFKNLFPQAKQSWVNTAAQIASQYKYKKVQPGTIDKIMQEMVLYKLLSDKRFVQGDPQEEQRRIIVDVPKQLRDLKQRIGKAVKEPGKDAAADALVGNVFLENLTTDMYKPNSSTSRPPRIIFALNGPAVEGTKDLISSSWNEMLASADEGIRNLAIDLFRYNLHTNGFGYGMYEFAHFAPFSILMATPGYIDALQDVLKTDWNAENERTNFMHQYYMNHWGDKRFLSKYALSDLNTVRYAEDSYDLLRISPKQNREGVTEAIADELYIIITSGENNKTQTLYRVLSQANDGILTLVKARKLGVRNRRGQVTLQYNPSIDYPFIRPVVVGNTSAWGQVDIINPYAQADIDAPIGPNVPTDRAYYDGPVKPRNVFAERLGLQKKAEQVAKIEEKAEPQIEKNKEIDNEFSQSGNPKVRNMFMESLGLSRHTEQEEPDVDLELRYQESKNDNKFLSIVSIDADGKVKVDELPWTPRNIRQARKQEVFVELNKRLREILREKGVAVGTLTSAEARMALGGIADFDTAPVVAEGLVELIRLADGYRGERALPEEFAHVALEMLGHDNPLVQRLLTVLNENEQAMQEAYDGEYQEYLDGYGAENKDKLVLEAAGKLVAKSLLKEQEIKVKPVKRLISRIVDAIKSLFRRFRRDEVQNAILDANKISSKLAREMLNGKLVDQMDINNISQTGQFHQAVADITKKNDILTKLLKTELKRLDILKRRYAYANRKEPNASINATEQQIKKLESAIRNYKTEEAITSYLTDSLDFLASAEKKLDEVIDAGKAANSICKRLNTVRDTLYSFSQAVSDIRSAIANKEVQDTAHLTETIDRVSGVLAKFYDKYQTIAMQYFEEMLSNVYGEHGKTITIGKQKGRVISIHEMATRADHDISLATRLFNSLADCNDYVLKAVDDLTRNAKLDARKRAAQVRPKIEVAIARLHGSQGFMFEKVRGEDGKLHKTGKYISKEAAEKLLPYQKQFYDTMIAIKEEADQYLPQSLIEDRKIVMMRKYTLDRFKEAEGAKGKALEAWDGLKNRVLDMSDDIDFENYEVAVDFEGNKVDMLPVKFLLKGKDESYDDMSDDVATSMMAYVGMAYEYGEMNNVIGILENAKYMASQRDVVQKTGVRTQRETISSDEYMFRETFTKKQAGTNLQIALDDFYQMHIYGHIQKNEGTIGHTRISKRKVVDTVNAITSYSQMAINIPQRIANINTGFTQILIESTGKGEFNVGDVAWASKLYAKESADRLAETGKTDYDNKLSLWDEYFDIHQNNGRYQVKYAKGRMSRIFNSSLLYAGLTMGEDYLATTTSLALARNRKVKGPDGKQTNLWEAYEVKYTDPVAKTGAYLSLKSGYTNMDGSPITFEDEKAFSKKCATMNFQMQGIYNLDDRSAIQQYAFGALFIMYRKWIAPALRRRYAGVQYNKMRDTYEEGYHRTMFRLIGDILKNTKDQVTEDKGTMALLNIVDDMKALKTSIQLNWNKMTDYEKSNVHRSLTELAIVVGLWVACSLFGKIPPPEYEDDERGKIMKWWDTTLYSQMLRLRTEIGSQAPTPMLVDEAMHILKSPFAAIGPLQSAINSLQLFYPPNWFTEIKSGRYRGHSKAYKYFRELPIISMFKKVDNFIDPSPMIQYYKNEAMM